MLDTLLLTLSLPFTQLHFTPFYCIKYILNYIFKYLNYVTGASNMSVSYVKQIAPLFIFQSSFPERSVCYLTFIGLCIVIYLYSKPNQMHQCIKFILFWNTSTCFGWSFRPSSGVRDCMYSTHGEFHLIPANKQWQYLFDICLLLYVQS